MSMTPLDVNPVPYPVCRLTRLTLGFDFSAWIGSGQTLGSPTAQLLNLTTGQDVSATGITAPVTISGSVVSVALGNFAPGHSYRLVVGALTSGGQNPAFKLEIKSYF